MDVQIDKPKVRRNYSISGVYRRTFLRNEFTEALDNPSHIEFAKFQKATVCERLPDFKPDYVNIWGEEFTDDGEFIEHFFLTYSDEFNPLKSLNKFFHAFNKYRILMLKGRGRFLTFNELRQVSSFDADMHILDVLEELNVSDASCACYGLPFYRNKSLSMAYVLQNGKKFSPNTNRWELEYFSLPFLLGWLHRTGFADDHTLDQWLHAIEDLTPMQVFLIRDIVNVPGFRPEDAALKYGISRRTVEAHVQSICEEKLQTNADHRHSSRLLDIARHFNFMVFAHRVRTETIAT